MLNSCTNSDFFAKLVIATLSLFLFVVTYSHAALLPPTISKRACMVSDLINPAEDGYGGYPLMYYPPHAYSAEMDTSKVLLRPLSSPDESLFDCDAPLQSRVTDVVLANGNLTSLEAIMCKGDLESVQMKYRNDLRPFCPVSQEDVNASASVVDWPVKIAGFCNLKRNSGRKTRIIVLGGSHAKADYVYVQCCLDHQLFMPGPYKKCSPWSRSYDKDLYYCSWSGYLSRWLRSRFPNKDFEVLNLAQGGCSSRQMSFELEALLDEHNITSLNSDDIVLLDHSHNDQTNVPILNVELLLRSIYAHASEEDPPTVVLLEQEFRLCHKHKESCYMVTYRKLAKHYNLPIFSSYSALESPAAKVVRPPLVTFVLSHFQLHTPSNAHLYLADMMAGWVEVLLSTCSQYTNNKEVMHTGRGKLSNNRPFVNNPVPKPLEADSTNSKSTCLSSTTLLNKYNLDKHYILHAVPTSNVKPEKLAEFEAKLTQWTEYTDRHQAGWIINKHVETNLSPDKFETARLLFVKYPMEVIKNLPNSTKILIRITHLKTYEDAGFFSVFPCGASPKKTIADFDSMYVYTDKMQSVPVTAIAPVTVGELLSCQATEPVGSVLSAETHPNGHASLDTGGRKGVYFGLKYQGQTVFEYTRHGSRKNYKVKILSILLCISGDSVL